MLFIYLSHDLWSIFLAHCIQHGDAMPSSHSNEQECCKWREKNGAYRTQIGKV
jgi:hypothetical protein